MAENCLKCRFCEQLDETSGVCRRYAPRPCLASQEDGSIPSAEWFKVWRGDWCGEFIEYMAIPATHLPRVAVGVVKTTSDT